MVVGRHLLILAMCAALLNMVPARATASANRGSNVVVLLFRTEAVQRVQVRSRNATVKLCATCVEQSGPVSLDLQLRGNTIRDNAGKTLKLVQVAGEAEILTGGGHRAEAAGTWRIDLYQNRLRVRVELSQERYVEAVLAAEASPNEPAESLKALAVVVRSFAAAATARHEDGALCDSTHCQALRLEAVPQRLRDAAWSTSGETLWFAGKQVSAYFSQHCGGFTEDAAAVWGGPYLPWLSAHPDSWCVHEPAAWHASLAELDVRRALETEGYVFAGPIQQVTVAGRDRSGRVRRVQLHAANGTRTLSAATLRFALNRSLGWNQLRSDRFQVKRTGDRILFEGSGYGHGVGLCQKGAAAAARTGKSYREILGTYFPGTTVRVRADDAGWSSVPGDGYVLRTTTRDSAMERDVARALADARARWSEAPKSNIMLTIFPSTEAFRQATGQPGWELAVTQGSRIASQPATVLRAHGGITAVLRHEFLHSFVEGSASVTAPLWLREGIVTVANGENCAAQTSTSADAVDAVLHAPASLAQSQQAHEAACALTRQFIARRGMSAARQMLLRP